VNAVQKQHVNHSNTWRKAFIGTIEDISAAAQWINTIAAEQIFSEQLVFALQICLEELLTNIVRHGGAKSSGDLSEVPVPPLNVEISISIGAQSLSMTVEDDGKPFDIVNAPANRINQPLDEVQPGGLGIQLIRNFSNSIAYEQAGLGNRVIVEFLL
jgi:anti-sigma regulatory factor (Ser/Thr protein kinase)